MTLVIVIGAFAFSQQKIVMPITDRAKVMEAQNRFLIEAEKESILLPHNFENLRYLESIRKARIILNRNDPPIFLRDEEELIKLGEKTGSEVYQFNNECQCIQSMGEAPYRDRIGSFRARLAAGAEQFLSVSFEIEDQGLRKIIRWKLQPSEGSFNFFIREYGMFPLPTSGESIFGLDITGPIKQDLHVYIHLTSPEGWIARSPLLTLNPVITNQVSWSGKSAVNW
jgi:hypothetical protein